MYFTNPILTALYINAMLVAAMPVSDDCTTVTQSATDTAKPSAGCDMDTVTVTVTSPAAAVTDTVTNTITNTVTVTSSAAAAPSTTTNAPQGPMASVFMCDSKDGGGSCQNQQVPLGSCTKLNLAGHLGTVRNDSKDQHKCTWFLTTDCTGSSYDNQDDENLTDGNGDFASMQSALCG